jgi:hypothetical protein
LAKTDFAKRILPAAVIVKISTAPPPWRWSNKILFALAVFFPETRVYTIFPDHWKPSFYLCYIYSDALPDWYKTSDSGSDIAVILSACRLNKSL